MLCKRAGSNLWKRLNCWEFVETRHAMSLQYYFNELCFQQTVYILNVIKGIINMKIQLGDYSQLTSDSFTKLMPDIFPVLVDQFKCSVSVSWPKEAKIDLCIGEIRTNIYFCYRDKVASQMSSTKDPEYFSKIFLNEP